MEKANPAGPVYRFAKISNGAYFFTGNEDEKSQILTNFPDFRFEGIGFQRTTDGSGLPVYRFANLVNGGYFYTASAAERDFVVQTRADMRYEGSTFSVPASSVADAVPVFRLANLQNLAYLYTASASERDFAVGLGIWRSEGVAFHSFGTPLPSPLTCAGGQIFVSLRSACETPRRCDGGSLVEASNSCSCHSGQSYDSAADRCLGTCPAGQVFSVARLACEAAKQCTGGTLDRLTNSCSCPAGQDYFASLDRCLGSCSGGKIFVLDRNQCEVPISCTGGTVEARANTCLCPAGSFYSSFTGACMTDTGFLVNTRDAALGLADLGGDGGSGGSGGAGGAGGDGGAGEGAVKNATVEFWGLQNRNLVLLGSALSDSTYGLVRFQRGRFDGPAWVRFKGRTGATYFDESLNKDVPFPEGKSLNAFVPSLGQSVGVSALTEAAFQYSLKAFGFAAGAQTTEQAVQLVLLAGTYAAGNDLVLKAFNAQLPTAARLPDITSLPYPLTLNMAKNSLPDNKSGKLAVVLSSTVYAAKQFNDQLRKSNSTTGALDAPALYFTQQFAADLLDGKFDARKSGAVLTPATQELTYATSPEQLVALSMPVDFTIADTLRTGVDTAAKTYANPSLGTTVNPPPPVNPCEGVGAINPYFDRDFGPLCCPNATRVVGDPRWQQGCVLQNNTTYRRVFHLLTCGSPGNAATIHSRVLELIAGYVGKGVGPANVSCSAAGVALTATTELNTTAGQSQPLRCATGSWAAVDVPDFQAFIFAFPPYPGYQQKSSFYFDTPFSDLTLPSPWASGMGRCP